MKGDPSLVFLLDHRDSIAFKYRQVTAHACRESTMGCFMLLSILSQGVTSILVLQVKQTSLKCAKVSS